jgi:anthranilate synthase component 1
MNIYPEFNEFRRLTKEFNVIPVYTSLLLDMETPVSIFYKLLKSHNKSNNYLTLLESVETQERIGRYSFILTAPKYIFVVKDSIAKVVSEDGNIEEFPFINLSSFKKFFYKFKFAVLRNLPRFTAGAVGYISYDYVRCIERLPEKNVDDLGLPLVMLQFPSIAIVFDHIFHNIWIINCVYGAEKEPERKYKEASKNIKEVIECIKSTALSDKYSHLADIEQEGDGIRFASNFTKSEFLSAVRRVKNYIRNGDVVQAVISQRFSCKIHLPSEPFTIYRYLRIINPSPYMYFFKMGGSYIIGTSPEILVRKEKDFAETRPIAGTRPRGKNESEDVALEKSLYRSVKERAEHVMLVDLGRNDLGKVCRYGTVKVPAFMQVERYSHVMHLVSSVVGKISSTEDMFSLFNACFPAGTVTGAPKVRAMEIIEEIEPVRRGIYAGAIGYFGFEGNMDMAITIRTIVIHKNRAYIQAGAGIVADSSPEREYYETINKAKGMMKAITFAARRKGEAL